MITLRQLEVLVLVGRLGSLTKAARELRITQSAVSLVLRQMEDAFGLVLFDRTTRSLQPTAACREALGTAERILADMRGLDRQMHDIKAGRGGHLKLAVSAGVAFVLPRVIARFMAAHPEIKISLLDVDPDELVACVKSAAAEFGIGNVGSLDDSALEFERLLHSPLSAISLRGDPIAATGAANWDDLRGRTLIAMRRGTRIRDQIEDALAEAGKSLGPAIEVSLVTTSLAMTAEGAGLSVLPAHMLPAVYFPALVATPLQEPTIVRHVSSIRRRGISLSPAATRFLLMAREILDESSLRTTGSRQPLV